MYSERGIAFKLGEDIKPSTKLRTYYYLGLLVLAAFLLLITLPIVAFAPLEGALTMVAIDVIILVPLAVWSALYYKSISYHLSETEMVWKRGVWFRATAIVPYTKVTNIDIVQGPLMRALGIATLKVQTAGFSGTSGPRAELKIEGFEQYEALRDLIMRYVRGQRPQLVQTAPASSEQRILEELVRIREVLEKQNKG